MIVLDPSQCTGCRRCEVYCSFFRTGGVGRARARVRVVKLEEIGLDCPIICQQCRERYCLKCPESAIEIGPLGQLIVSPTLCSSCGTCQALCPIGAIELVGGTPYVCDLCGGSPRCVRECTLGAITFHPDRIEQVSLEPYAEGGRGLSPEARRTRFAREASRRMREEPRAGGAE